MKIKMDDRSKAKREKAGDRGKVHLVQLKKGETLIVRRKGNKTTELVVHADPFESNLVPHSGKPKKDRKKAKKIADSKT